MDEEPKPDAEGKTAETGLALLRAKEALRFAEAALTFQGTSLVALETRAQAVVGWAVAGATALLSGLLLATLAAPIQWALGTAMVTLLVAAGFAGTALKPSPWTRVGNVRPAIRSPYESEREFTEAIALGLADGIDTNDARLNAAGRHLSRSIMLLIAAPGFALAAAVARWLATFSGMAS
jgi:hypothetical protein